MDDGIDHMRMLEVSQEAYDTLSPKMDNVLDFQKRHAVLAIMDGAVPEEVAAKCGFESMPNFGQWLCHWMYEQIVGK